MSESVVTDWKARHPFKVGDKVVARRSVGPLIVQQVWMRGESELGLWIAFEGVPFEYSVDDFEALPADGMVVTLQPTVSNAEVA